jgi:hypothetical protein
MNSTDRYKKENNGFDRFGGFRLNGSVLLYAMHHCLIHQCKELQRVSKYKQIIWLQ